MIAEIGVNHNGQLSLAKESVLAAMEAGADCVKFQTFDPNQLVTRQAAKAAYQYESEHESQTQFEMLSKLMLTQDEFIALKNFCDEKNIKMLSTPFDINSADFLVKKLELNTLKIGSGDLTHGPLLWHAATLCQNIILSTGMATLEEIKIALGCLALGWLSPDKTPTYATIQSIMDTPNAQQVIQQRVTLLHCTSSYPTPYSQVNLNAMLTLTQNFGCEIGYSDHTPGISVPIAATVLGASVIEKHFTLDTKLPGPDHKASLDPNTFSEMVKGIREVSDALGAHEKKPQANEIEMKTHARRSLVANDSIAKGKLFSEDNISVKRPGNGINPMQYWDYIGQAARKFYVKDDLI